MAIDPDLLAIQHKRRQQGRCLRCGAPIRRQSRGGQPPVLCAVCMATHRVCYVCERVLPIACMIGERTTAHHSVRRCRECGRAINRAWRQRNARPRRHTPHAQLDRIIELYRAGMEMDAIAAALAMTPTALRGIIHYARKCGDWPRELYRAPARARVRRKRP